MVTGCESIGQTPSGGSDADVKEAFNKLPIDVRARELLKSPAPQNVKTQQIKDLYAKEGKPVPEEFLRGGGPAPTIPNAPAGSGK